MPNGLFNVTFSRRHILFVSAFFCMIQLSVVVVSGSGEELEEGGGASGPGCTEWEKATKDEIAKAKETSIKAVEARAAAELQCVEKVQKVSEEKNKKIKKLEENHSDKETECKENKDTLKKWKDRAEKAEKALKDHQLMAGKKQDQQKDQQKDLEQQLTALQAQVKGWHSAANLVAKWAKREHEERHTWLQKHSKELAGLSETLRKEKVKYSESFLKLMQNNSIAEPRQLVAALKTLYIDAKIKRRHRDALLSKKEETNFESTLKTLEREAPPGFLRGQRGGEAIPKAASAAFDLPQLQQPPFDLSKAMGAGGMGNYMTSV